MQSIFTGKNIVVCVTGSIAAFKVAGWVSALSKEEAHISVIMSSSAKEFIGPMTFSSLSGARVYVDMFDAKLSESMVHIELAREADIFLVVPASANTIAKLAFGIADNLLTTTILATKKPVVVCPAMNTNMYHNSVTQKNVKKLKELGYIILDPDSGLMACKEVGEGRLIEWEDAKEPIARVLSDQDLLGVSVVVTAGPTRELIDPVRYISNRSSGKMGYALAADCYRRGAQVTLISGPTTIKEPIGVSVIRVQSAKEMYDAVMGKSSSADIVIKTAAVADFTPATTYGEKIKKDQVETELFLKKTDDILLELGKRKNLKQILVGFAAESSNHKKYGKKKLSSKNLDFIAINDISSDKTGFEVDNNQILLISEEKELSLPFTTKSHTATLILNEVVKLFKSKNSTK